MVEIELHLEQLIVDLDMAARQARERIHTVNVRPVATAADEIHHRTWLRVLLTEMSSVVDRTARRNGTSKERRLHVWPGYDSVLLGGTRITFEVDPGVRELLADIGYANGMADDDKRVMQTGVSFSSSGKRIDRATLYFDAALAGLPYRAADCDSTFSVGGTHNWLALGPDAGSYPLIGFEVRTDSTPMASHRSFPSIHLDSAHPLEWGDALAAAINGRCGESPRSFWPMPTRRGNESWAAYGERLEKEYSSADHRGIRQRLYSLWLIGCFAPDPATVLLEGRGPAWLSSLISDLQDVEPGRAIRIDELRELERNVDAGSEPPFETGHFTTWGVLTIPCPIAGTKTGDDGDESDDLGSGMLLSNFDVPYWYYFVIRQWIASYYLSLRQHENSALKAEREAHKAAMDAERQLRRQLSHAVGTELTYIEFLANVAADSIAQNHFSPRASLLIAGVEQGPREFDANFVEKYGNPTPLEETLIGVLRVATSADQLLHDVSLIEQSLAAVPAEEGRKVIGALATDVARVGLENRALVRVDEASVIAKLERSDEHSGDKNAERLTKLLNRALVVSLTVYFRKAFPPSGEGSEGVCLLSADALFADANATLDTRRTIAKECAIAWRGFIAQSYRTIGDVPPYAAVRSWLHETLQTRSRLQMHLPDPSDMTRLKPGCGEYAPLVIEAWLTEALLNALKHSRAIAADSRPMVRVDWLSDDNVILEVSNTTTLEKAAEVKLAVEAAVSNTNTSKKGHQGLAFLGYAARHLFEGAHLQAELLHDADMLRLCVR